LEEYYWDLGGLTKMYFRETVQLAEVGMRRRFRNNNGNGEICWKIPAESTQ